MKNFAVIVAGGKGSRMGSELPKQFLELKGKPILVWTIEAFLNFDSSMEIILVLPADQHEYWKGLQQKFLNKNKTLKITTGGETRYHSVKNGLDLIQEEGIVGIHDGVRPLVSADTLKRTFKTANEQGNALPVMPSVESLRRRTNEGNMSVDRSEFFLVQTPQVFQTLIIKEAFELGYSPLSTDDASVFEANGGKVVMVEGNRENIKITTPEDIVIAEAFLR